MPVPHERDAVERHLLRDTAYAALCDAIVSGTLAPGEQLHDDELCAWLGLSRTPVRGALARLEDDGLVQTQPQRSTRVAPLTPADARDLFPVVASLHELATELAVPQLDRDDILRLRTANDAYLRALAAGDRASAWEADEDFHAMFVAGCANAEIERALAHLLPRLHRIEALHTGPLPGRRSVAQHEAILARAASGDAGRAGSAAREHWLDIGAMLVRALSDGRGA